MYATIVSERYMLHTIAGKFLKGSYFWSLEKPGCYTKVVENVIILI
jgi:hypothetical protein